MPAPGCCTREYVMGGLFLGPGFGMRLADGVVSAPAGSLPPADEPGALRLWFSVRGPEPAGSRRT
eukprot:7670693-Karenia_brevis.AAC.1